jgi:hypothetical protein
MQSSRAFRALPVVLWFATPGPLAAQARYRVIADGAWFHQEAGGKRLARLVRGTVLAGGEARGDWQGVTLEGWIFAASVGPAARAGYDLAVTRAPEENLRAAPAGALIAKLPQGFLLARAPDGGAGRWVHVTRAGWVERSALAPVAEAAGARPAGDSGAAAAAPAPAAPAADAVRVAPARRATLYREPEGAPTAALAPTALLRVVGRSGEWTRVELEGWVKSADLAAAPPGVLVGVTAAELRADPARYAGQVLRWTLQTIALQQADELRPDIPAGATYLLARGPLPERGFVYVIVPDTLRARLATLAPLSTVQITARVRTGRSRFLGNPVLDLISLETLP